jgi:ABC-2 type transport system ATP-binding protein
LETMKMHDYVSEPIGSYSTGMLKKLSLLLAFLGNAKLILLDEPTITLDAESLQVLYAWIALRCKNNNTSFLIASHQPLATAVLTDSNYLLVEDQRIKFRT